MTVTTKLSTPELFSSTNRALIDGRWVDARAMLDELARRTDNRDQLASMKAYSELAGRPISAQFAQLLQDRIDLVNAKATG